MSRDTQVGHVGRHVVRCGEGCVRHLVQRVALANPAYISGLARRVPRAVAVAAGRPWPEVETSEPRNVSIGLQSSCEQKAGETTVERRECLAGVARVQGSGFACQG